MRTQFIINLPSEIWKVSEVHRGVLRKKPLVINTSYFPPSDTREHLSKPPLNWKRRLISVPKFSRCAASKSTLTLHQQWPFSVIVLRFTSLFLSLNVRKSVMHIWNWFETHFAACWCCMEKSQKKFTGEPQVMKSLEACNTTYKISYITIEYCMQTT